MVKTKELFFKMEKRGKNGESLLHMCLLCNTTAHDLIAKRIITFFPQVVNEICLSDETYGQTALHLAVEAENVKMLIFLINNGANLHMRCLGNFFSPRDQYFKRKHVFNSEIPIVPLETDYMGDTYFGEYPLSFAACLIEESCVRILLSNKANPDMQDSNGNTVVHMMVLEDNLVINIPSIYN